MKIKKLPLLILLSVLITTANMANAQTKVGIKAGVNVSKVMMKDENGNKINTESVPGILLGLTVDIPVTGDFIFNRQRNIPVKATSGKPVVFTVPSPILKLTFPI